MKIGENGSLLSGGEKQRDLARAIARKSMVTILDEPSSNLDSVTEKIIKNAIKMKRERSLAVIVHRSVDKLVLRLY